MIKLIEILKEIKINHPQKYKISLRDLKNRVVEYFKEDDIDQENFQKDILESKNINDIASTLYVYIDTEPEDNSYEFLLGLIVDENIK